MSKHYSRARLDSLTPQHLTRMNIGKRYWGATLQSLPSESAHGRATQRYVEQFDEMYAKGAGLYLWGANSTGKTYTACSVLKEIQMRGYSTYCVMADKLRSIYIDKDMFDPDMSIVQRVESVDVLLIEDLGKEYTGKGSGWAELCFENLLRTRTRELKPTLITTNLSPKDFGDRYKESAQAIALESTIAIQVKGDDQRRKIQNALQAMVR